MYRRSYAITPDNANDLPEVVQKLYVGTGGDITLELLRDTAPVLLKAVPTGTMIEAAIRKIYAAGTGAQNLVGFLK